MPWSAFDLDFFLVTIEPRRVELLGPFVSGPLARWLAPYQPAVGQSRTDQPAVGQGLTDQPAASRPSTIAIHSENPSRPSDGAYPVSSVTRRSRYRTVFGCTKSIRAVASSEDPCSR
jgi:hypothetical protein